MTILEATAYVDNIDQFSQFYRDVQLDTQSAQDIVHIVKLALSVGALEMAIEACEAGLANYPDDTELSRLRKVLAPPRITISHRKSPIGTRANTQWLKVHGAEYRAKVVALRAGELIASGNTIDEVLAVTGNVQGTDIFITPIH